MNFLLAYITTLLLESAVLIILLQSYYSYLAIFRNSFIANTFTIFFVWFFFPLFLPYFYSIIASEIFAFVVEAFLYSRLFNLEIRKCFLISFIANFTSFIVWFIFLVV
ncbi:MAG: hypothetical protein QW153_00230 [Candidatus Bilamarchaeaceae archaeon]